jgi:hypothetical protein
MSAATLAAAPLRRRTLERTGMTPEQELELLIVEQRKDDNYFIDRENGMYSLDAPWGETTTLLDLVGVDDEGEIVVCFRPEVLLGNPQSLTHGLRSTYVKHECRCKKCSKANSTYISKYRARRQAEQRARRGAGA